MKRSRWQAQLLSVLVYPLALLQAHLLFHPDDTGQLFLLSFVCLLFGVVYAFIGYLVRDRDGGLG